MNIDKRLAALEQAQQRGPHFPSMTRALLVVYYGTPDEIAAWEAAGRPEVTATEFDAALDKRTPATSPASPQSAAHTAPQWCYTSRNARRTIWIR